MQSINALACFIMKWKAIQKTTNSGTPGIREKDYAAEMWIDILRETGRVTLTPQATTEVQSIREKINRLQGLNYFTKSYRK